MNVLKRKSATEKFVCKESIESIIVLPKRSSGGKTESGVDNRSNLRTYSNRAKKY